MTNNKSADEAKQAVSQNRPHYHYMGWSSNPGGGAWIHNCISNGCELVDVHQTVRDLSWYKLLKFKLTKAPLLDNYDEEKMG